MIKIHSDLEGNSVQPLYSSHPWDSMKVAVVVIVKLHFGDMEN